MAVIEIGVFSMQRLSRRLPSIGDLRQRTLGRDSCRFCPQLKIKIVPVASGMSGQREWNSFGVGGVIPLATPLFLPIRQYRIPPSHALRFLD